jgi:hypothetical protein
MVGVPVYGFRPSSTDHELLPAGIEQVGVALIVTGKNMGVTKLDVAGRQNAPKVELFAPFEIKVKQ